MPGADVWRNSETSRGLDPDGWLVRRIRADATCMKTRMCLRAQAGVECAERNATEKTSQVV